MLAAHSLICFIIIYRGRICTTRHMMQTEDQICYTPL
jgi:hypothetical protein